MFFGAYPLIGPAALWIAVAIIVALDVAILLTMLRFWPISRTAAWLLLAVTSFGVLRYWSGATDLAELALLLGAGGLGAAIHRAELAAVRALRGPTSDRPGSSGRTSTPAGKFSASLPHST